MERTRQQSTSYGIVPAWYGAMSGTPEHGYSYYAGFPDVGTAELGSMTKTTTDWVTSNYRKRIQDGAIINNPFVSQTVNEVFSNPEPLERVYRETAVFSCSNGHPATTHHKHYKDVGEIRPAFPGYIPVSSAQMALEGTVRDAAVTQAHANIDVSEMLALATVAESGKSVQSMMGVYSRLKSILRKARRLRVRELAMELSPKELSNRWMEVRYAIRPLIYDAYGIANAFQKNRGYERRTYRGSADDGILLSDQMIKRTIVNYMYIDWARSCEVTVSARAGVLCDVSINDLTVFGVDQLFETAWELAPLSFVVDWFVNVGDWIAAHSPNFGVTQRASWVTTKTLIAQKCISGQAYGEYPSNRIQVGFPSRPSGSYTRDETVIRRTVNPAISTFPAVDVRLDTYKLTDMGIMLKKYLA